MTTPSRPPLWREMETAGAKLVMTNLTAEAGPIYAAEILAMRDWLKGWLPEGGAWYVLLTAEAERAEASE